MIALHKYLCIFVLHECKHVVTQINDIFLVFIFIFLFSCGYANEMIYSLFLYLPFRRATLRPEPVSEKP